MSMPLGLREEREILAESGVGFEVKRTARQADGTPINESIETVSRASVFGTTGRRKVDREPITVGGCTFTCDVYTERTKEPEGGVLDGKWWVSDRYPYVIRTMINGAVMQELIRIERASR